MTSTKPYLFLYRNSALTCDYGYDKEAMLDPNKISNDNNCIE